MSDIQEGDVWNTRIANIRVRITGVGEEFAFYKNEKQEPANEQYQALNIIKKQWTLIERDGKPVKPERVFEEGYYWVGWKNNKKKEVVAFCQTEDDEVAENNIWKVIRTGALTHYRPSEFQWIGEKLEEPKS